MDPESVWFVIPTLPTVSDIIKFHFISWLTQARNRIPFSKSPRDRKLRCFDKKPHSYKCYASTKVTVSNR